MQQVILDFGQVQLFGHTLALRVYGYGLMLVLGFLLGIMLARWRAKRFGENPNAIATVGLLALVGGVIGARVAFIIERWNAQYSQLADPLPAMLDITSGGLVYYGGVVLAIVLVLGYLAVKRLPVRRYLDILAPSLMIGLAFGRMGCLLNGCCYGGRVADDCPLAMKFPYASQPMLKVGESNMFGGASVCPLYSHQAATPAAKGGLGVEGVPDWLLRRDGAGDILRDRDGLPLIKSPSELTDQEAQQAAALRTLPVQPVQAYAIVDALLIAGLLLLISRLRRREGEVFAWMLILYPIVRIIEESLRGDNPHDLMALKFTHNQYTSLAMIVIGIGMLLFLQTARHIPPYWRARLAEQRQVISRKRKGK